MKFDLKDPTLSNNFSLLIIIVFFSLIISACTGDQPKGIGSEKPLDYNSQRTVESNALAPIGPNGMILSPKTDLRIAIGDSVDFSAIANDPTGDFNISYLWNFDNAQANSIVQNPGLVTFLIPGQYEIELTAINSLGQADLTADVRKIIVENNASQIDLAPIATINSPVGDITINMGDVINFSGSGISPIGNNPLSFLWNFGDTPAETTFSTPGDVQFNQAGEFVIQLVVTDSAGVMSIAPAMVTVTVNPIIAGGNLPPTGMITSPPGDLTIMPGDSIYFAGSASDPDGNNPITYLWDFSGVIPESNLAIPDNVMFPTLGSYTIRLMATDALGLIDPNPPQIKITVTDASMPPIPILTDAILTPTTNLTINLDQMINFTSIGVTDILPGPLSYLWMFGGAADDSLVQNPGDILFSQAGVFNIELIIADVDGNIITDSAVRTITVIDPAALSVIISEPAKNQSIFIGDSVNFSAEITDPMANTDFIALWTFDGAVPDSTLLSPGNIIFEAAGEFVINLSLSDPLTDRTAIAEPRMITVVNINGFESKILSPANNQIINMGDTINFSGEVIDPLSSSTLEFLWDFDGAIPNSTVLTPGDVIFEIPGNFTIEFDVSDPVDLRRTQTSAVEIQVRDPNALQSNIISPANDMFITLGDSIDFSGEVIDPISTNPLTYSWNFGMTGITSSELNPGQILFDLAGEFEITFIALDASTMRESMPTTRTIYVTDATSLPPPPALTTPRGIIESPDGDLTIALGTIVVFEATGMNPINSALNYHWNFNGGMFNLQVQNPGSVMFNTSGEYIITLIVSNSDGLTDPNPPSVVITVN